MIIFYDKWIIIAILANEVAYNHVGRTSLGTNKPKDELFLGRTSPQPSRVKGGHRLKTFITNDEIEKS